MIGNPLLTLDAVFGPRQRLQTLGGDRLLAGEADSELAQRQTIQRFLDLTKLQVVESVQPQRNRLGQRMLSLVFLGDPVAVIQCARLRTERIEHRLASLQQDPAKCASPWVAL